MVAKFVMEATRRSVELWGYFALHDPMAVGVAIDPSLVKTERYHVDVEVVGELTRGETVADRRSWLGKERGLPNVNVCTGIQGSKFVELFLRRIGSLKP